MTVHKLDPKNQKSSTKGTKASTRVRLVKHRYRGVRFHENGLLNVERKTGKYLKIARQNQRDSPLLRLPLELRCLVFEYALGGKTFEIRYVRKSHAVKNTTTSKHALALLSVCRQIFAETALLPFSLNTFSALHPMVFNMWIESFRPAFAEVVTLVRIDILALRSSQGVWYETYRGIPRARYISLGRLNKRLSSALTSLKFVQIAFTAKHTSMEDIDTCVNEEVEQHEGKIRERYESANSGIKIGLTRMMR